MKHILTVLASAVLACSFVLAGGSLTALRAEDGDNNLVRSLKPAPIPKKGLTRGLGKKPAVDKERVKSRGLVIEVATKKVNEQTEYDRKEIVKIVEKYKLPTIDMTIYFDYNSAKITPKSYPTLVKLGKALLHKDLKGGTFLIGGHTDARGSDHYNLQLSRDRAAAVKDFLMEAFHIEHKSLLAIGFGEEELKDAAYPESGENRRVQITNLTH